MKVINANWEKQNFGYDVTEVYIEDFDTINDIGIGIDNIESKYIVVKAPIKRQDIYKYLSDKSFYFVEVLIDISFNLDSICNNIIECKEFISKRFDSFCDDVNEVLFIIKSGAVFKTDRVALDPYFSFEISGIRYYNWIYNLISEGNANIVINYMENSIISFAILKKKDINVYECILWGVMPNYIGNGYGVSLVKNTIDFAKNNYGKKLVTTVSSNNLSIINCINKFKFKVDDEQYIFIRHK